MLIAAHNAGRLKFFGKHADLDDSTAFIGFLKPFRKSEWVVYAKEPFGGPEAVLAYLSRYTHRVAISNHRLLKVDSNGVTFKWKDYRINGPTRYGTMTLPTKEFIRRFLSHVLPRRFHRIRHYGLLANGKRAANVARARQLLNASPPEPPGNEPDVGPEVDNEDVSPQPCPCCVGRMIILERFDAPRPFKWYHSIAGIDSS